MDTGRHTHIHTDTDRHTDKHTPTQTNTHTHRQTHTHILTPFTGNIGGIRGDSGGGKVIGGPPIIVPGG